MVADGKLKNGHANLGLRNDVEAGHVQAVPAVGFKSVQDAKSGGLASAVGPKQAEDLAGMRRKRNAIDSPDRPAGGIAKRFAKAGYFDHRVSKTDRRRAKKRGGTK